VLFKFSYDPLGVIRDHQARRLNLIPFALTHKNEMIANIIAFIPFGVMIGVNFKQVAFSQKYAAYLQSVRWRWVPGVA
jgi:glycopeptide antibiotics resistance protein